MKTYNTYQEAKIDNPESEIYTNGNVFAVIESFGVGAFDKCNPADHCMTVEQFLNAGHKFVEGDFVQNNYGAVAIDSENIREWNHQTITKCDRSQYILRAAALEKPKRVKVEYVKVEESIFDLRPDFEAGELYFRWVGNSEEVSDGVGYDKVTTESMLLCRYEEGRLLRRVETEISERDEFIEEVCKRCDWLPNSKAAMLAGKMFDAGCRFKLVEGGVT